MIYHLGVVGRFGRITCFSVGPEGDKSSPSYRLEKIYYQWGGGGVGHKNTIEFKGGEENFTAAQIKLQQFTAM